MHFYRIALLICTCLFGAGQARTESMLQLFNLSWNEVAAKMPEMAEAGYTSLWLPPPTKGGSGYSIGYDLWDPFDLGDVNQRGTVATRYGTREEFARTMEFLRASEAAWREENEQAARAAREANEREIESRNQRDREARLNAEVGELRSRKRFLQAVVVLVPALLAGLAWALYNRNEVAIQARAAEVAAEEARQQAQQAQKARDESQRLLERLTNSNKLKQAFLRGDVATIRELAADAPADPPLEFATRRTAMGWKTPDGKPVYRWDLYPADESRRELLRTASQISYYMNHPSFVIKLLSAGAGSGFTATYNGWGCLSVVYVLIEYIDPDTPPRLLQFDQCSSEQ